MSYGTPISSFAPTLRTRRTAEGLVALLLETGLLVGELARLTWAQVSVRERSGWVDVVGKRQKHRRVPLNAEARTALAAIRAKEESPPGPVFRGKRGP